MSCSVLLTTAGATKETTENNAIENALIVDEETQRQTVEAAASAMLGEKYSEDITVSEAFIDEVLEKAGENPTAQDIASVISGYVAIYKDWSDKEAQIVAESSGYYIADNGEFFIVVDLVQHPEALELSVLCKSAKLMYDKQNYIAATTDRGCAVMDYRHIVGELALHNTVYALTKVLDGENETSPLHRYYESAKLAELNTFETRGVLIIKFVGTFLDYFYRIFTYILK